VEFVDKVSAVGLGSNFADIITQMAQDVGFVFVPLLL
jgi:THO complex subunit 2